MRNIPIIAFSCSLVISIFSYAYADNDVTDYLNVNYSGMIVGNPSGNEYDTSTALDDIPGNKISGLTIYYNGHYLTGLKVDYLYGDSVLAGSDSSTATSITLAPNEYITSGSLYRTFDDDSFVSGFIFNTSEGNSYDLGKTSGDVAGSGFTMYESYSGEVYGYVIMGFKGTSDGSALNSISLVYGYPLELEYSGIEFDDNVTLGSATNAFLADSVGINATSAEQSTQVSVTYSKTDSSTDSYSSTAGISETMGISVSTEAKTDAIVSVSEKWEYSYSIALAYSETVGSSETESSSTSYTDSATMNIPAKSIYAMRRVVYSSTASFPYTITYTNPWDNAEFTVKGSIENATAVSSYNEWLEIGYVKDDGTYYLDPNYTDDYGDIVPSTSSTSALLSSDSSSTSIDDSGATTATLSELNINITSLDEENSNWIMSDDEIQFRQENGITD
ncbi:hypothetical protein [uncultured Shewanella sp.]|uniref:jacalin-like lectin n=1 Tax=uncultured Shewanella sp. TaxID=173975 RepID=UPI0026064DA5|nr:hypothetical protein [uncultured Shewanella sp.]